MSSHLQLLSLCLYLLQLAFAWEFLIASRTTVILSKVVSGINFRFRAFRLLLGLSSVTMLLEQPEQPVALEGIEELLNRIGVYGIQVQLYKGLGRC